MVRHAVHVLVSGRVQGVGFRHATRGAALRCRLAGWVRNRADGRVEVWAEGAEEDVEAFVAWLRRGPPTASVTELAVEPVEPGGRAGFELLRD
ncbi:MAG: acylphosphatase [Planctomycetes bacterium]|nr:acylphosphatase [Planctomycetota bacterium]